MEWLKTILAAQGLNEAQIKAIVEGVTANYTGYVPPHRFEEVNTAKKKAEDDLKERDKQLDQLQKSAAASEELKKEVGTLKEANKAAAEKHDSDLKELQLNTAIKLAITGEAHDPDIVSGLIDKSKIILGDDGKVTGLDDQIKSLRESKAFLFAAKDDGKPRFKGFIPKDGKDGEEGKDTGIGADFAKAANEASKAPAQQYNPWG